MKKIKIYTTKWCPYCIAAKQFLKNKGWNYEEINIDEKNISRQELMSIGKGMSVPQIIIDGKKIGGYDDMVELFS